MQRTVGEIEGCKAELGLPQGAEETLSAFPRAVLLLQPLQELEQLTQEQSRALEVGNVLTTSPQHLHVSTTLLDRVSNVHTTLWQCNKCAPNVANIVPKARPLSIQEGFSKVQ